jgi:PadR family transcriptional regulator AphA
MKAETPTEYVILGALIPGSRHGYEIIQLLASTLEATWRVSTSQLYVLLKKLEKREWLKSRVENQETRPAKRVFKVTPAGERAFEEWLHTPVIHVRDFRAEFLSKLFFFYHLRRKGANGLVEEQIQVLEKLKGNLQKREKTEKDRFIKFVYRFKVEMVASLLSWLLREGCPFVKEDMDDTGKIPSKDKGNKIIRTGRR